MLQLVRDSLSVGTVGCSIPGRDNSKWLKQVGTIPLPNARQTGVSGTGVGDNLLVPQ